MARQVSLQVVEGISPAAAGEVVRLDRCIANAERHVEEQEARLREAALGGRSTALDEFDLQKMQLLLAILREGRQRVAQQLDPATSEIQRRDGPVRPAEPSASG
jgi:hypothetical protein